MTYEDVTIEQYINAKWKDDISVLTSEQLKFVEEQYVDTAGLYESEEFSKVAYIHYLNTRVNSVKLSVRLQYEFIENFNIPYLPEIKFFNKFGHRLVWHDNIERFIEDLRKVESKEKKYISQLENSIKELTDLRAKKAKGESPKKQTRTDFIATLISLGKIGYRIKRTETSIEELSLMIKKQSEEAAEFNNKHNNNNQNRKY